MAMDSSGIQDQWIYIDGSERSRSFSSAASPVSAWSECHNNLPCFLAVCQECHVDILPIRWQQALGLSGEGGTAKVNQSQVNQEMSLVFKRWDWARFGPQWTDAVVSSMYKAFISEVWALTRPTIRDHPNVVNLEGICWEFPDNRPTSPVLVFEKAQFGDLSHYIASQEHELSLPQRIDICLGIARTLKFLHSQNLIHGDLKPDNILMFRDENGRLIPKITDFGFSTLAPAGIEAISLARSEPWSAPEIHHRKFTFSAAKKTDIFSLGMLSLWILFSEDISECNLDTALSNTNGDLIEEFLIRSRKKLKGLKERNELLKHAKNLIGNMVSATEDERSKLEEYFEMTLESDPNRRAVDLELILTKLGLESYVEESVKPVELRELFGDLHPVFDLSLSFQVLMLANYRVREQLFEEMIMQCKRNECSICTQAAMISTSVFYQVGFGTPRNPERATFWATKSKAVEELQLRIDILRSGKQDRYYENKRIKSLLDEVIVETLDHTEKVISLDDNERFYSRELEDMEKVLGSSHHIVHNTKRTLALIFNEQGSYRKAADLMIQLIQEGDADPEYGPNHSTTITMRNQLAATLLWLRSWREAEMYAREAVWCSKLTFGPTHPLTDEALQVLTAALRLQGEWKKAERLQIKVVERKERFFGSVHPRTLQARSDLSEIYSRQGLWTTSQAILEEVSTIAERDIGIDNSDTLRYMIQHGAALRWVGRYKEAEKVLLRAAALSENTLGKDHYATIRAIDILGSTYHAQGRLSDAEKLIKSVLEQELESYGEGAVELLSTKAEIALIYIDQHRLQEAELLLRESMEGCIADMGGEHPETLTEIRRYAFVLGKRGHLDEAEDLLRVTCIDARKTLEKTIRSP